MATSAPMNGIDLDLPLSVNGLKLRNRVFMAPMSGVTDLPFRRRGVASGAGLAYAEMVASGELERDRQESIRRIRDDGSCIRAVQIIGREPDIMASAARRLADDGAQIIDINMGCPAKKVTSGACGAALMGEPERAARIVEAVVDAASSSATVTVKMRLGWDAGTINAPVLARRLVDAGAQMITVHGRTREQRYAGRCDPEAIALVRQAVGDVPLVANGDVTDRTSAIALLNRTGADAVMIGRANYGQPFLAGAILQEGIVPDPADMPGYVTDHYCEMIEEYGPVRGNRHARKHLGWYLDRFRPDTSPDLRRRILTAGEASQTLDGLAEAFSAPLMDQAA